jgi:hypothetical protein
MPPEWGIEEIGEIEGIPGEESGLTEEWSEPLFEPEGYPSVQVLGRICNDDYIVVVWYRPDWKALATVTLPNYDLESGCFLADTPEADIKVSKVCGARLDHAMMLIRSHFNGMIDSELCEAG